MCWPSYRCRSRHPQARAAASPRRQDRVQENSAGTQAEERDSPIVWNLPADRTRAQSEDRSRPAPMPIISRQDASDVETRIRRIFDADSRRDRVREFRHLFVETLDFEWASGEVGMADARANVTLPDSAARVAALDGVNVAYVHLDTRRVRNVEATEAVRLLSRSTRWRPPHGLHQPRRQPTPLHLSQLRGRPAHAAPHGDRTRSAATDGGSAAVQHLLALAGRRQPSRRVG